jgi:DNA (cytosine-5)-methyltransferase 1
MGTGGHNVPFLTTPTQMGIRKLTPLECERLQGLPDNFTKYRIKDGEVIENSDNERYERCGRTVTIPVIEAIGKKLGEEWYA